MDKILDIIEIVAYEKGLQIEAVQNIIKDEILKLAKENISENKNFIIDFDQKDKTIKLFYKIKILNDDEPIDEYEVEKFMHISKAKEMSANPLEIGDEMLFEINIDELELNRSIISKLRECIENNIERNIESQIFDNLKSSIGKIVNAVVIFCDKNSGDTILEVDGIRAKLPKKNRIKGESFEVAQSLQCILRNIYIDKKYGIQVELSRTTPKLLEELLFLEVPEISDGEVSIVRCSRIPGVRAKVAVKSNTSRVDAVGATVGVKGVRINAVSKKICGESIDCVEFSDVEEIFIANALSPAKIASVKIENEKKAIISLYSDQKSKAIGKDGINIRLASMLLDMELEINDLGAKISEKQENTKNQKENLKDSFDALFKK